MRCSMRAMMKELQRTGYVYAVGKNGRRASEESEVVAVLVPYERYIEMTDRLDHFELHQGVRS